MTGRNTRTCAGAVMSIQILIRGPGAGAPTRPTIWARPEGPVVSPRGSAGTVEGDVLLRSQDAHGGAGRPARAGGAVGAGGARLALRRAAAGLAHPRRRARARRL